MEENSEMQLREHQIVAIQVLDVFDKICKKHNIEYFLFAGSALGAIRHKGFIPWDDDIDIGLRVPEFNKLKKIIEDELDSKFTWKHTDTDCDFPSLMGRITVNGEHLVTVFPIIKLGDGIVGKYSQWIIRKIASPIYQRKVGYREPKRKRSAKSIFAFVVSSILSLLISKPNLIKIIRWNETRYENCNTKNYVSLYGKYSLSKESFKSEWVDNLINVIYEDKEYPIFRDYHQYLSHVYGKYMEFPPDKLRTPPHI